jgi:DNA-binding NarL/FixJ family response regulator
VQRLGAFRQFGQVAFLQGFGEIVEQAPHVPSFECIMTRLSPLMQHGWDETIAAHANIRGANDEAIPVVVLSSSHETTDLAECYRHGVNGYVVKAVDYQGFMTSVRQIGAFWGKLNETVPSLKEGQA